MNNISCTFPGIDSQLKAWWCLFVRTYLIRLRMNQPSME